MSSINLLQTRPYDLAQPYYTGMPHFPSHPPFLYSLTKRHGDILYDNDVSSAADAIALGTHVGTHIDALSHFSCNGLCFGGQPVNQTYEHGMEKLGIETIAPIVRRAVLLDVPRLVNLDPLPDDFEITPAHLEEAAHSLVIRPGTIVLIRTGWANFYPDPKRYVNNSIAPGINLSAAQWLSAKGIYATGSDTIAFERLPSPSMSVHKHLLVDSGIHIIEVLNLEELARDRICEFLFIAAPMPIRGATGAPVRPLAFPD